MAKRLPSPPPVLPGFTYIRPLGTGGFSDVFLYEQDLPRREVAIKVMLANAGDTDLIRMFQTEADALARLAAHPSILSVFSASRAADGRPFLVMEYCPSSYATVYRDYLLSVNEVLDVGVRMAGALESAHRAGLVHRDVKPSNILRTTSANPVLSDFGVATTRFFTLDDERVAMSIPWSSPEVIREAVVGSVSADVWSLGATVYSLLAGRSPFERDGEGVNTPEQLQRRIKKAHYTAIDRDDVPHELETVLARSMSEQAASRQSSARVFGEELQQIQRDLGLSVTELEIVGDDTVTSTVENIARASAAQNRLPEGVSVAHARRLRRSSAEIGDGSIPHAQSGFDRIPGSTPRPRHLPRWSLILAGVGSLALIGAILVVTLGR
jgi:serine/threonine protein kinase